MSSVCCITSKNIKLGSDKPVGVGVGVAPGAVLLDSITVYSGTTTPNNYGNWCYRTDYYLFSIIIIVSNYDSV